MKKIACLLLLVLLSGGCVARQSIRFGGNVRCEPKERLDVTVKVDVRDERPYVKSGEDPPNFIGHYRAGFGNSWNVSTEGQRPLADIFREDLARELACLGFTVVEGKPDRIYALSIYDWSFDTYINAEMWYDLGASVASRDGVTLASDSLKDRKGIPGSFWVGPKSAVEEKVPVIYDEVLSRLLRNNEKVLGALKGR